MSRSAAQSRFMDMMDYAARNPRVLDDPSFASELRYMRDQMDHDMYRMALPPRRMLGGPDDWADLRGLGPPPTTTTKTPVAKTAPPSPPKPLENGGTVFGEIIAWRVWKVKAGWLRSVYRDDLWMPETIAEGKGIEDRNEKGIHAWKDQAGAVKYGLDYSSEWIALGHVKLWGTVIEHERGYRAEFGRLHDLVDLFHNQHHGNAETLKMLQYRYRLIPAPT